ncbi:unnamed protein product [Arctia plantaginis]|uniref:ABC-type xenobiotic transporter n=1 Tax=Arctia plantaginis TaxID=874455 RepID=A0A8S0Z0G2_ARCPL|nr:unnamed protein product [Arctia plantaginis]
MTETGSKENKTDKAKKNEEKVSYFSIFRYGTKLEVMATCLGVILGMLSGGGITVNLIQLGELSTAFVERTHPPTDRYSTYLPVLSAFGGGRRLFNATREENMEALVEDAVALAISTFVTAGIAMLLTTLGVGLINWSALRQITTIRQLFLKAVLRQDMSWFDTDTEFNLASKMSENLAKLKEGMGEKLGAVSNSLGTAVLCFGFSLPLGWELALACATVMPFSIAAAVALSNYQTKSATREMESYSQAGKHAEEILKSVRTVAAFGGEAKEVERYSYLLQPAEQYGRKRGLFSGLGNGFNWILTYFLNAIGLTYGARLVLQDMYKPAEEQRYVVGIVFSVLFSVFMATQSLTLCIPHIEVFAAARGAAASIFQLLDRIPKIDSFATTGMSPRRDLGDIALENVYFSYPSRPDIKILNDFSIHIKRGECVALVGSSGCGKSTILQLLQRLYEPSSGSVKLDGKDVKDLNLKWLRSSLGVVGQEPVLFRGTIFENIAIGCPEATLADVQRVAIMSYAHEFITNLPKGYNTVIGERGASLSGGQKQRIAIARSLLRDPAVLLLDEATSALDPHSERQVQAALDRASAGRTTIMVSHRLATIVNAKRIICMDKGTIVEQGSHEELIKNKGFYYKLVTVNNPQEKTKSIEDITPLPEEAETEEDGTDTATENSKPRTDDANSDIRKHEHRKRIQKQNSVIDNQHWMTPRGSISSVVSVGYQSFMLNADAENKENIEEQVDVTGCQILKLNSPEWIYITIGSIAAFAQGACFPVFSLLFVAVGILMGFGYDWRLTLVSSAFLPVMVGSIWLEGRMSQKSQSDEQKALENATSVATEAVVSIKTVQSLGIEMVFLEKFQKSLDEGCAAISQKSRWRGLILGMGIYIPFVAYSCANVYGTTLVANGTLEYKVVLLVTESVMFGAYMLGQTLVYAPSFNNARRSASKILSVVNRVPAVRTEDGVKDKLDWNATGNFSLKGVEFSYPTRKRQKVLRGIDLKMEAGKTVALVGSSGCGKSTILQLIQRFYDPDEGAIELDGVNAKTALTLPRLRQQLGVVQQEPILFDRTLAENIAYGDNNRKISINEIIEAAKAANIHSFITSLPKGYDTNLGSGGAQLSGGQKQRVCIARALIRSPRLLLLDEATSALDANSEQVVSEALDKAAEGRTCITIAHRLSTIKNSDLICVLDKGKIVERGNHEELLSIQGLYYRMCKGQNMA